MNLSKYLPGILMAATGVGAGDLITASLAGHKMGIAIFWIPLLGAFLKYYLSEGIARIQIIENRSLLLLGYEKWGKAFSLILVPYFCLWCFVVGQALLMACAVAAQGIFKMGHPLFWAITHGLLALFILNKGKIFEKIMAGLIGLMFIIVLASSIPLGSQALLLDHKSNFDWFWAIGVLGGVGGTLTLLSYGHWIEGHNRVGASGIKTCRQDLGLSYFLTALFNVSMIIIGASLSGQVLSKTNFAFLLSNGLNNQLGGIFSMLFLWGFWAGVFSSLLGVLESIPHLFKDVFVFVPKKKQPKIIVWQILMVSLPLMGVFFKLETIQLIYAFIGALFMPFLAILILVFGSTQNLKNYGNSITQKIILSSNLILFTFLAVRKWL